jgi:hypothetical protein
MTYLILEMLNLELWSFFLHDVLSINKLKG